MGVTSSNKQINVDRIDCGGMLKVTIALSAAPDISSNPTDIVLVLDCSGSMAGTPLANMKTGAKTFLDILDEATDGSRNGHIGSGSRIGLVSFAETAVVNTQMSTSVATLKSAVDNLTAGGATNHADAFGKALQLFDPTSSSAKVIVMFTDGKTTTGLPPAPVAAAARAAGVIIYCIGLVGVDGISVGVLNEWATDPDASHVAVTPDDTELEDLFRQLATNISKPGATNVVIDEVVQPDFSITSVIPPSKGTAMMVDLRTIQWRIAELGVSANEGATLEFYVKHNGSDPGMKRVNESITYSDQEGNVVVFPDPSVMIECGVVIDPEPCPEPIHLSLDGCQDSAVIDAGDFYLGPQGRILQLDVTIKRVCPGKRVALAVLLSETAPDGKEHPRGMKTLTIPAHHHASCRDVVVQCIKFVLPENLDIPQTMCNARDFQVRVLANYIDTDFICCDAGTTMV